MREMTYENRHVKKLNHNKKHELLQNVDFKWISDESYNILMFNIIFVHRTLYEEICCISDFLRDTLQSLRQNSLKNFTKRAHSGIRTFEKNSSNSGFAAKSLE